MSGCAPAIPIIAGSPGPPTPGVEDVPFVPITDFGATLGAADNTTAIQDTIDDVVTNGGIVLVPAGSWNFLSALTNPSCVPIWCLGELVFGGSGVHALTYGTIAANTVSPSTVMSILSVRRATQDWTDPFSGVRILNVYELQSWVTAQDFECGLLMQGDGFGVSYCQMHIKRLYGNRVGIRCHALNNGWSNENTFWGGRFSTLQATASALSVHAIEYVCDSALSRPNGDKMIAPSIELHNTIGFTSMMHGEFTVGTIAGQNNTITDARFESTDYWISGEGLVENTMSVNYLGQPEALSADFIRGNTAADDLVLIGNIFDTNRLIFGSADPVRIAGFARPNVVAVGASIFRPARGLVWNRSGTALANTTPGTVDSDSISLSNADGMGTLLDFTNVTRDYQRILTLKATVRATGGRFFCVCWDAGFNLLTGADDCSLGFNAGVGYYRSGSDMTADAAETAVTFGANVAYVLSGVASGTAAANIEDFDVFALGASDIRMAWGTDIVNSLSTGSPNIAQMDIGDPIAVSIPSVPGSPTDVPIGTWVRNLLATTMTVQGWVYNGAAWIVTPTTLALGSSTISGSASIDKPDAGNADFTFLNLGVLRWRIRENSSENWLLESFDAAGVAIGTPISVTNATGLVVFGNSVAITTNLTMLASAAVVAIGDTAVAGNARLSFRKGAANNQQYVEWLNAALSVWGEQFSSGSDRVGFVFDGAGALLAIRPYTFVYNAVNGRAGVAFARRWDNLGTTLVNGDFALSASMGNTATAVVEANSKGMRWIVAVTVNGSGIAASPTVTLTYPEGTWTTAPKVQVVRNGGTGLLNHTWVSNAATVVITLEGTPAAGEVYNFTVMTDG